MAGMITTLFLWLCELLTLTGKLWKFVVTTAWKLNGVEREWRDICDGRETQLQAQVLYNWYTIPFTFEITTYSLFTTHECFAPASIVLRPNVHLLSVQYDLVKFVEMDPTIEPLNIRKNPILLITQTLNARKIIILPRRVFDQIMDDVNTDEQEVVWLFHSVRCGSTLWAQIFNTLPNWTVISETQVLLHSLVHAGSRIDIAKFSKTKEFENMVVLFIKSYLRLVPEHNSVLWKALGVLTEHMIPVIHKRFPKHRIMLSYRDILPSAKSYHRLMGAMPIYESRFRTTKRDIRNPSPTGDSRVSRMFWSSGCTTSDSVRTITKSDIQPIVFEWFVLQWAARMRTFREHQSSGIPVKCLKYDSLVTDAKGTVSRVFEHLGISLDLVESALKVLEQDSQAGLSFSRDKRKKIESWSRTAEAERRCNIILEEFGFSNLDSTLTMPETF